MRRSFSRAAALAAALFFIPALAVAAPLINLITPDSTSANTGATVTIMGSGFGASDDVVTFPGPSTATPTSWGSGWVVVVVPATWSGDVTIQSHGVGASSNAVNHNISFSRYGQWSGASMTWWLNQNGAPGCSVAETQAACAAGYGAWVCASGLTANYQGTTATVGNSRTDGINVLNWLNSGWGDPNTIAVCSSVYYVPSGNLGQFDINFNSQHFTWSCAGAAGAMDVQNVAIHEEGHSIGFYDLYGANDGPKTMYGWGSTGQTHDRTLERADVEGAEFLYPHAGRPDMTWYVPAGWFGPIVPRNTADATDTYAPLPSTLNGNGVFYMNAAVTNAGSDCATPGSEDAGFIDGGWVWTSPWGGTWWSGQNLNVLNAGLWIPGGRHALRVEIDRPDQVVEGNEGNNIYQEQFVWSPYVLTDQVPVTRAVPPEHGPFTAPNCDGFQFTGNWWGCVAAVGTNPADDYDLDLFEDYVGSLTGFLWTLTSSSYVGGLTDFVLVNGNATGYGATRWAGVRRYSASVGSDFVIHQSNQVGGTMYPDTVYADSVVQAASMGSDDLVKVHEVYLGSPTRTYNFTLENASGTADLDIGIYSASASYFARVDYLAASQTVAGGRNESFDFRPPSPGYYGVVVWKRGSGDLGRANDYRLRVGVALSNLVAGVTPPGFSSPVVPRSAADAAYGNATLPPTLPGNQNSTYLNWATEQAGPNDMPGWGTRIYVDIDWNAASGTVPDYNVPGSWQALNIGPITVRGGRHMMTSQADWEGVVPETNESDNAWTGQWVWSPLVVTANTPVVRAAPPNRGYFVNDNGDGMQFTRGASYAWVVSLVGLSASDDYDLYLFDDYSGSTAGFSNLVNYSQVEGGSTEFVVGHYSGTPTTVYPEAINFRSVAWASYVADQTDAAGRNASGTDVRFAAQTLAQDRLANVYEAYFYAGTTYHIGLGRTAGTTDLAFAVFPGTAGEMHARGDPGAYSTPWGPTGDSLAFTASETAWHPIVVYRPTNSDLLPTTYDLFWNVSSVADVPGGETPTELRFAGAVPNPVQSGTRFEFALPASSHVRLTLFDLGGRRVRTLVDEELSAGPHQAVWDGSGEAGSRLSGGLYFARLEAGSRSLTRRVTLLR